LKNESYHNFVPISREKMHQKDFYQPSGIDTIKIKKPKPLPFQFLRAKIKYGE